MANILTEAYLVRTKNEFLSRMRFQKCNYKKKNTQTHSHIISLYNCAIGTILNFLLHL